MRKKIDSRVSKGVELASQMMDNLQLVFGILMAIAFAAAVAGLTSDLFESLVSIPVPAKLISFLSTVLMVSLIGTVAKEFLNELGELKPHMVVSLALIGSLVGVLEDWLAPATSSKTPEASIAVVFSLIVLALLIALLAASINRS